MGGDKEEDLTGRVYGKKGCSLGGIEGRGRPEKCLSLKEGEADPILVSDRPSCCLLVMPPYMVSEIKL